MIKALLDTLIDLYDKNVVLLGLFREERQSLIDNDLDKLQVITIKEMELGLQISLAEKERREIVIRIKSEYSIDAEVVTIQDISSVVDETHSKELTRVARDLKELLAGIMDVRMLNDKLIQKMLGFNERNIKLFMNLGEKKLTYDGQGKINHSRKQILDSVV